MWRLTIVVNNLLMVIFWVLSLLLVAFAHNRFVQYPTGEVSLPIPTEIALSCQTWLGLISLLWIGVSAWVWKKVEALQPDLRNEYLLTYTMLTICVGLLQVVLFGLAGILPFLLIGAKI